MRAVLLPRVPVAVAVRGVGAMGLIDRGEGHPANRNTVEGLIGATQAIPAHPVPGMGEMAKTLNRLRADAGPRLVCEHGPGVVEALRPYTGGRPEWLPSPALRAGTGLLYRQVEFYPRPDLGAGGWRLLADGELIGEGVLGDGSG